MRRLILFGLSALAICLSPTTGVQAQSVPAGHQGFTDIGIGTASPTGNINTATTFGMGNVISTATNDGVFASMPSQTFGPVTFDVNSPTSFTFGNSVFGHFTSTAIHEAVVASGIVGFSVPGQWTPGTYGGVTGGPFASSLTITFNQTPPTTGGISSSFTFAIPPEIVPEPSSMTIVMTVTSLAAGVAIYRRCRSHPGTRENKGVREQRPTVKR
jgi:hypothetical protein